MFLVPRKRYGATHLLFVWKDPRTDGFKGDVVEDVTLDYDMDAVHHWADGDARPEAVVGRDPNNPKHFKVFKYTRDLQAAGYQPISGRAVVFGTWPDFVRFSKDWEHLEDEEFYASLDELDVDSRRRQLNAPDFPASKNRDDVAAWVAKRHRIADSGIREVWYLPHGSPPDEIRLLEVNERLAGNGEVAEAIDFGLDVEGERFRLFVADVTTDQLEQIQEGSSHLPQGWSLEEKKVWRRGA